ncbi:MAG: class I SAM-dependent methyltransferase [Candidatus Eiseniibacteriota bacterium]
MSRPTAEAILAELTARANAHPEDHLLQFGSLLSSHQYLRLYGLFRRYVPEGARVLDWGTGNGHFSYFLLRAGFRASGYSFLDGSFVGWLPDAGYDFTRGDAAEPTTLPYGDATFDAVASIGVLEHVRETGGTEAGSLSEIVRVLKPGGRFVCFHFPNQWSWIDWAARRVPGLHRHDYRYGLGDIRALASGAGLTLEAAGRYGLLPRNFGAHLPHPFRYSAGPARAWDAVDGLLGLPFSAFCQNYYFVARKGA